MALLRACDAIQNGSQDGRQITWFIFTTRMYPKNVFLLDMIGKKKLNSKLLFVSMSPYNERVVNFSNKLLLNPYFIANVS